MKIEFEIDEKYIDTTLHQVRDLQENFIQYAIENESPGKDPEDFLHHLRTIATVDDLLLKIKKEAEKEKVEAINH